MQTRNTMQKDIILKTVNKMHNHPTAEMVHQEVIKEHPAISKATVYRNLNQMVEQGSINRVRIPDSADRYDFKCESHYHLKCSRCGKVYDVNIPYLTHLDDIDLKDNGFSLEGHHIIFEGICPDCNKK